MINFPASFHTENDWRTTITKGGNIHWCSRKKHNALRALLIWMTGEHFTCFVFYKTMETMLTMQIQGSTKKRIFKQNKKQFPPLLMHLIVIISVPQLSLVWKNEFQNTIVTLWPLLFWQKSCIFCNGWANVFQVCRYPFPYLCISCNLRIFIFMLLYNEYNIMNIKYS